MKPVVLLIIAMTLIAAKPADDFETIWQTDGPAFEAQGIDKPMARLAFLWTEFQYHLGMCGGSMDQSDLAFWRLWWHDTPLEQTEMGKQILAVGDAEYYKGINDRRKHPLTAAQCQRVINSWSADLRQAMATAR